MLLDKGIDKFIKYLENKERSSETIRGYNQVLQSFKRKIEEDRNSQIYIDEIEANTMENYLQDRRIEGDSPVSRNRSMYIFRSFYNYLVRMDIVEKNIALKLEPVAEPHRERKYLTRDEMELLLDNIEHETIQAACYFMAYTGTRVTETTSVKIKDLDMENNLVEIIGKGNKMRMISLNPTLKTIIKDYIKDIRPEVDTDYLFATSASGSISPQYINRELKKTCEKLENDPNEKWTKGKIKAHILRHSFSSLLISELNAPISVVQKILGHADLRITSTYLHNSTSQMEEVINQL